MEITNIHIAIVRESPESRFPSDTERAHWTMRKQALESLSDTIAVRYGGQTMVGDHPLVDRGK
jgi:hypothetical protein